MILELMVPIQTDGKGEAEPVSENTTSEESNIAELSFKNVALKQDGNSELQSL